MNEVTRSYKAPGEYSKDIKVSFKQAMWDIANAYEMKEQVTWESVTEEETDQRYGATYVTVTITHDEGHTTFNWSETYS